MRFLDREEAGIYLARGLAPHAAPDGLVLALPRGGVPVGWQVARLLALPFEVLAACKVRAPGAPDMALGAVAEGGSRHVNLGMAGVLGVAPEALSDAIRIARPLFFDDPQGGFDGEGGSYLFGSAFLVSPVVSPGQTARSVGLPRGLWYDFWTDRQERGGVTVTVPAPLETIPLFVRAGSIIPMQPVREWTGQTPPDTLFLAVYPSPSGPSSFELVEDDGETLGYDRGETGRTMLEQSLAPAGGRASLSITIGRTQGTYPGRPPRRVYLSEVHGIALAPVSVTRVGLPVPRRSTLDERNGSENWS